MIKKIIMPSGGQTTDEMYIEKWNMNEGDTVKRGDILFEIETDKASMPVESFTEGILLAILFKEGETVKAGEAVAYIGDPGDKIPEDLASLLIANAEMSGSVVISRSLTQLSQGQTSNQTAVFASPLAKKMAKIENIRLEEVAKSCSKSLIKKEDILTYIKEIQSPGADGGYYLLDTSLMRRTIARRMKESVLTSPHYFVTIEADMTDLVKLRNELNKNSGDYKISYNDLLMKIAAFATKDFPLINSTYQEEKIRVFKDVNFGLAVGLEQGLVAPVVKQANKKSVSEIAESNNRNIAAAKNGSLKESDITGGTITLSNLGMYGINNFTAVINQPESCIIAVGAIIEKPVVRDHKIVIREMMNITCSFDHRVIDGTMGAAFLERVKQIIEDPGDLFSQENQKSE